MVTMVLIGSAGLMLTMFLMRTARSRVERDRPDGIRWRGIDWSRAERAEEPAQPDADQFKNGQD